MIERGLMRLMRDDGDRPRAPYVSPEQWLRRPCAVEEYPGMVLMTNQVNPVLTMHPPEPDVFSVKGLPVVGRAIVLGVNSERKLVTLTPAQVARIGLVAVGAKPQGARQLVLLPCGPDAPCLP